MADTDRQRIEKKLQERRGVCRARETDSPQTLKKMMRDMYADWVANNNYEKVSHERV